MSCSIMKFSLKQVKTLGRKVFRIVLLKRKLSLSILFLKGVLFASGTNSGISPKAVYINEKSFIDFDGIWIMLH